MSNPIVELSNATTEAVEKAEKFTVLINARQRIPSSGIVFAPDLVLTADHTVERDEDISIGLPDGSTLKANVAGRDPGSDLVLLKLEKAIAQPAELATQARIGQIVLALGRPSSAGIEASLGVLSAINGPVRTHAGVLERYYRTDTTPYPGFSGGPLVNVEGKIMGINTSGFGTGMSITIPAEIAWKLAGELAKNGSIKRGYLGIRSQPVELNPAAQAQMKRNQASGLLIVGLEPNSPAEKAGILVGDILVGIKDYPIAEHDDLMSHLSWDLVGISTPIEVVRGGTAQALTVVIEERQPEPQQHESHHEHRHGHR